jgi:hypothetical protein
MLNNPQGPLVKAALVAMEVGEHLLELRDVQLWQRVPREQLGHQETNSDPGVGFSEPRP